VPYSLAPVPPFGVPRSLDLAFWAGLWGVLYAVLERRLTASLSWLLGGLAFGLAGPLLVFWFVVLPLKGAGIGGGFHPATALIQIGFHAFYGIGAAILFRSGLALTRWTAQQSPKALHG
jgi:hypothetical protein